MIIFPAIDLKDGNVVRLTQGAFDKVDTYSNCPADFAKKWEAEGAEYLHVVDLDGAREGKPVNLDAIKSIVNAVNIPVQLGGGIRSLQSARQAIDSGVTRTIFGTAITRDDELAGEIFSELADRSVVGIDARNGLVSVDGWSSEVGEKADEFAARMQTLGAKRIIYTDISRDGMLSGINFGSLRNVSQSVSIPVIASGGVGNLDHVRELKAAIAIESLTNVEGLVVGKALYTGNVDLQQLLEISKESH